MTRSNIKHRWTLMLLGLCLATLFTSCSGMESKRIRQLLHEKGFGSRAQGVGTYENYVAGGDGVVFFIEPSLYLQPGFEQLALLTQPQSVSLDGTIFVPYVGPVPVLGLTQREVKLLVEEQVQVFFNVEMQLQARIINAGKAYYVFGESIAKGRLPFLKADLTLLEAVASVGTSPLANLGRVRVVRPDAQNPLIIEANIREMILTGNTTYNIRLQDNDIVYIPPTFFGTMTRFVEKLLSPVAVISQTLFSAASLRMSYNFLVDPEGSLFFPFAF
ncbi:MAG: polysaccharide biosynthesis/export family protein [Planctomycetota bacterium]|nr:polysaccharide biosynthesis/export family protein [Planctomycetota bacterium]